MTSLLEGDSLGEKWLASNILILINTRSAKGNDRKKGLYLKILLAINSLHWGGVEIDEKRIKHLSQTFEINIDS